MSFFRNLFTAPKITCPRCLGKGDVDGDDIRRLHMELEWGPGTCAYCDGSGKVPEGTEKKVAVNESYLTTDLALADRLRLRSGDPLLKEKSRAYHEAHQTFRIQVLYLHNTGKLTPEEIATFFLLSKPAGLRNEQTDMQEKNELVEYLHKLIASGAPDQFNGITGDKQGSSE